MLNRLILGVGSGSTRDDFELLGYDYDHRFRTFKNDLEIMNRAWTASRSTAVRCQLAGMQGRPANPDRRLAQPPLDHLCRQRSPGLEPLRPVQQLGRFRTRQEDLSRGTNAVLANCSIDLAERPESAELAKVASVNFIRSPEEARRRIKRVEQLGFEKILIGSQFGAIDEIERVRDFLKS